MLKFEQNGNIMKQTLLVILSFGFTLAIGQTNISLSSFKAESYIKGSFDPSTLNVSGLAASKGEIVKLINNGINPDSLKNYIIALSGFKTRHTASDTVSETEGIGAARRWAFQKFQSFSPASNHRLVTSYMQFDLDVCGVMQHKNVLAVLPGTNPIYKDIIIVEGHMDSKCEGECDVTCVAQGVEDNASGSALVLEIARVLSQCALERTVVFMLTTGEEQGLLGASAFANYAEDNGIQIRAVLNNDVVGGIACGSTASQPGCSGEGTIDSTHFRIFSRGGFNSTHKQFARYTKLQYNEEIKPFAMVPMEINIMTPEDRTGRGGDHIPFARKGYTAVRFTAANEHGNASVGPGYTDRQHTSDDVLGVDTDSDGTIDSFYVDFRYLQRNTQINAVSVIGSANSLATPEVNFSMRWGSNLLVQVMDDDLAPYYAIAYRGNSNDWDSVVVVNGARNMDIWLPADEYLNVSIAGLDGEGLESLFSGETRFLPLGENKLPVKEDLVLLSNRPNPFDLATTISVNLAQPIHYEKASIRIIDVLGREVVDLPIDLKVGVNEVEFAHGLKLSGLYFCSLWIDGKRKQQIKIYCAE